MDHFTLTANDIKAVIHAIEELTMHHGRSLQQRDQQFLVDMGNRLQGRREASLTIPQASWLTNLLTQVPKRTTNGCRNISRN